MAFPARRDTDADWRAIGEAEPYWGVLSEARFRRENLDAEAIRDFYATGEADVAATCDRVSRLLGGWPTVDRALDFGCGAGRLTSAMAAQARHVHGYDVSPAMLQLARKAAAANTVFSDRLPDGPFDWINSHIVFQHIEPRRGLQLLDDLLARLAPSGFVTLHFTLHRDPGLRAPPRGALAAIAAGWRRLAGGSEPAARVSMFDYELSAVVRIMVHHGLSDILLHPTNHAGHHGAQLIARRPG